MRIAVISNLSAWGGSEELWRATADAALADGHQGGLWLHDTMDLPPRAAGLCDRGARVFRRRALPGGRFGRFMLPLMRSFRNLPSFRPDVVCVSQPNTYSIIEQADFRRVANFLRRSGTPYVLV